MKKAIILLFSLLLMNYSTISSKGFIADNIMFPVDTIRVLSTPDLYSLSNKWASEYNGLYPDVKIKIINVSDSKIVDKLIVAGNIGFVSNKYYSGFKSQSLWRVVVGRDVIVPVINSKNPFIDEIYTHGISTDAFTRIFKNKGSKKWGTLLNNYQDEPVNYYWINDESIKRGLTDFLNINQVNMDGIEVANGEKMILAIQADPYAVGFCKMINVLDLKNQKIIENIKLIPIDRNGNGVIDYYEKIYDDLNLFSRGVWIGKYPKPLTSNIYSISLNQPKNEKEVAFLKWILTDGQQYLFKNGYSDLLITERQTTVDKLYNTKIYPNANTDDVNLIKTGFLILAALIVSGLFADVTLRYLKRKRASVQFNNSPSQAILNENSLIVPKGLYFDKTHTWAFMEQNGNVKIGIDDFLQHVTGSITKIKMKNNGDFVKKGEELMSIIQNGKQLNLYAPVSGTIREQNKILETNPSVINSSPYNKGWIYLIEPTNWHRENQLLFMANKQNQFIKDEFSRLKDFLANTFKADTEKYAHIILQDGGELRDGILSNLGPEVWEDFQTNFIDPSRQVWFYEIF